jgi:hypothetical protein
MRFSLRTLLLSATLGPPVLAGGYFLCSTLSYLELHTAFMFGMAMFVFLVCAAATFRP